MALVRRRPLTPDSAGRYRPRIGWKFGEDGVRRQHKFNLGTDRKEAERRYSRIQALYEDDCQRNATQQAEPGCWSLRALKYATEIASGAAAIQISLDPWQTGHVDPKSVVELQQGIERARKAYPSVEFVPADPAEYEASAQQNEAIVLNRLQALEAELRSSGVLTTGMPAIQRLIGVTVRKALDMFEAHLVASPKHKTATGGVSAWGKTRTDQCKSLRFYHATFLNLDLGQLNKNECEQMIEALANRPVTQRGVALTQKSARNLVYVTRLFLQWLDGTDAIEWELPRKFNLSKRIQYRSKDITEIKDEVTTIPLDHLRTIIAKATEREKLYIGLALNCAYGADQLGRLQCEWIRWDESQIKGTRLKKMTASRHYIWACNLERLKAVVKQRTTGTVFLAPDGKDLYRTSDNGNSVDGISKAWEDHAWSRIRKADSNFPRYSFGKIRKTAATLALAKADPHIASMLLAHKTISDDELLTAYANLPWDKLYEAQREQELLLVSDLGL